VKDRASKRKGRDERRSDSDSGTARGLEEGRLCGKEPVMQRRIGLRYAAVGFFTAQLDASDQAMSGGGHGGQGHRPSLSGRGRSGARDGGGVSAARDMEAKRDVTERRPADKGGLQSAFGAFGGPVKRLGALERVGAMHYGGLIGRGHLGDGYIRRLRTPTGGGGRPVALQPPAVRLALGAAFAHWISKKNCGTPRGAGGIPCKSKVPRR